MKSRKFNCTQHELAAVCMLAWESCSQHINKFSNFKPKYTLAYVEEQKKAIETILAMPDNNRRTAYKQLLLLELKQIAEETETAWQQLRRHITEAWALPEQSVMLKAAGLMDFRKATKNRWESFLSLLATGTLFIEEHKQTLLANNNMPESFVLYYTELLERYRVLYGKHLDSNNNAKSKTELLKEAYNKAYEDLMSMCKDARVIFKDQPLIKEGFYFETMLGHVTGTSWAGIRGVITNGHLIKDGIPGLQLKLLENEAIALLEKDGSYSFDQLSSGSYTLEVIAPGYVSKVVEGILVRPGEYHTVDLEIEKIGSGGDGGDSKE